MALEDPPRVSVSEVIILIPSLYFRSIQRSCGFSGIQKWIAKGISFFHIHQRDKFFTKKKKKFGEIILERSTPRFWVLNLAVQCEPLRNCEKVSSYLACSPGWCFLTLTSMSWAFTNQFNQQDLAFPVILFKLLCLDASDISTVSNRLNMETKHSKP